MEEKNFDRFTFFLVWIYVMRRRIRQEHRNPRFLSWMHASRQLFSIQTIIKRWTLFSKDLYNHVSLPSSRHRVRFELPWHKIRSNLFPELFTSSLILQQHIASSAIVVATSTNLHPILLNNPRESTNQIPFHVFPMITTTICFRYRHFSLTRVLLIWVTCE